MASRKVVNVLRKMFLSSIRPVTGKLYIQMREYRISFYEIVVALLQRLRTNDILEHAYAMAFNFTLSIFPATIFVFTVIPYFPIADLDQKIIVFLKEAMPAGVYKVLLPTIQDTIGTRRGGLLSLGGFFTLYLATNGMMSLIKSFDLFHKDENYRPRGYLRKRAIATLLTIILSLGLFVAIVLLGTSEQLSTYIVEHGLIASRFHVNLILSLRFIVGTFALFMAVSAIYYLAPSVQHRWSFFSLGAFTATLLILLASLGFSYYVNNVANYNGIYGSIGVIILLMTWLFMLSAVLLIGFEINASIDALILRAAQKAKRQGTRS
ncbi:MAG: YihY/virulence factor BrkB family protein [Bacteroidota bacterium]